MTDVAAACRDGVSSTPETTEVSHRRRAATRPLAPGPADEAVAKTRSQGPPSLAHSPRILVQRRFLRYNDFPGDTSLRRSPLVSRAVSVLWCCMDPHKVLPRDNGFLASGDYESHSRTV